MELNMKKIKAAIFLDRSPLFAAAQTYQLTAEKAHQALYPLDSSIRDEKPSLVVQEVSSPTELKSFRKPNIFDQITVFAGSKVAFCAILFLVQLWLVLGFLYGFTDTWQIIFQNSSSIQVYITDILLIRQQQNSSRALLTTIAELQSRIQTCERLLIHISGCTSVDVEKSQPGNERHKSINSSTTELSRLEYCWNKFCLCIAQALGSIWCFILYWIGIGAWAALGPLLKFEDTWQLYINTATAVILTFTTVFLQNIQQHQEDNLARCLEHVLRIDAEIEECLRNLTGDQKPNPIFTIPAAPRSLIDRLIDGFADIMGSGLGVSISVVFAVIWISIGPLLDFQDNWWLIIGTFTGLVAFVNGFVLRSLYFRDEVHTKIQIQELADNESRILAQLNVENKSPNPHVKGIAERISIAVSDACGHRFTTVIAVGVVLALLLSASAMKWTVTGQLLCNTPTMIIEGFLLLVLIQAHNNTNEERNADFEGLLRRKILLDIYVGEI